MTFGNPVSLAAAVRVAMTVILGMCMVVVASVLPSYATESRVDHAIEAAPYMYDALVDSAQPTHRSGSSERVIDQSISWPEVAASAKPVLFSASGYAAKSEASRIAAEGAEAAAVHGNSRASTALTHLYRLEDAEGNLLKWGVTNNLKGRYSLGFLSDKTLIPMTSGSRSDMLNLERWIVECDPGPLSRERWTGSMQ